MWQKMRLERFGGGSELWTALSAKQGARNLMLLGWEDVKEESNVLVSASLLSHCWCAK